MDGQVSSTSSPYPPIDSLLSFSTAIDEYTIDRKAPVDKNMYSE